MIPIENSVAGRVADIHHLLPAFGPAHRRRVVSADPPPDDGAARRDTRRHQDGGKPRPCARPVPPHHPQARHQADRRRRYRRLRARLPSAATRPAPRSPRASPPISTGSKFSPRTSRTRTTTPRVSSSCPRTKWAAAGLGTAGHHFCFPRPQPSCRALQGDGRLRHQRRQHDQAGKLHGGRRVLRHACLSP